MAYRFLLLFLMHRVELKVEFEFQNLNSLLTFLMHRVELKEDYLRVGWQKGYYVPNAPCGVESFKGDSLSFLVVDGCS